MLYFQCRENALKLNELCTPLAKPPHRLNEHFASLAAGGKLRCVTASIQIKPRKMQADHVLEGAACLVAVLEHPGY